MTVYVPPRDDIGFVLDEIVEVGGLAGLPAFKHSESGSGEQRIGGGQPVRVLDD
jgi:hypothetical protein